MMISIAVIVVRQARRNASMSRSAVGVRNLMRFSDARLHAESSRNMYSEHGFDALMRAVLMHGCQSLMVVSYCMPGSTTGIRASTRMPVVDGGVVLHAGIATHPCGVGHLAHQGASGM